MLAGIAILIAIGTAAGLLAGFFGIGGGIIVIPALVYICGFSQLLAQGTSLAIMLPPVGLLAFMEYYKNGHVDIKAGIIICITMFLGTLLGAKFAHHVSTDVVKKAFALFLLAVSIKMLLGK